MRLALQQERTGDGKPARVDVGTARETVADGNAGVCIPALAAGERGGGAADLVIPHVVSSDRKTEPRGCGPALPLASGAQSLLASLPFLTRHTKIKFGMTHVHPE